MNKRSEVLAIALVLTSSAITAALTSDLGINQARAEESPPPVATADAPEREISPVVYEMDIPADVMNGYEADSQETDDPLPAEDQVASEDSNDQETPKA